ncbi:hypothetical protein QYF36_015868 [Acer negundo]|nr:hypothetical protein QYF36_015868 [Acer negundo]
MGCTAEALSSRIIHIQFCSRFVSLDKASDTLDLEAAATSQILLVCLGDSAHPADMIGHISEGFADMHRSVREGSTDVP